MLACSCLVPDGWVTVPLPDESYDLDIPTVFLPLLVCIAPYGAVVFSIAARPAFQDGTVQDWAEYLGQANNMQIDRVCAARVNRLPCVLVDATMPSDAGLMRSRSVFLEDGRRLYNVGTLAPDAIWASVASDFDHLLGSFSLDEVKGITAAPLRLMTSEPTIELPGRDPQAAAAETAAAAAAAVAPKAPVEEAVIDDEPIAKLEPNNRPTQAVDVALADDESSLDPEHELNRLTLDYGALWSRTHINNGSGNDGGIFTMRVNNLGWILDRTASDLYPRFIQTAGPDISRPENYRMNGFCQNNNIDNDHEVREGRANFKYDFPALRTAFKTGVHWREQMAHDFNRNRRWSYRGTTLPSDPSIVIENTRQALPSSSRAMRARS